MRRPHPTETVRPDHQPNLIELLQFNKLRFCPGLHRGWFWLIKSDAGKTTSQQQPGFVYSYQRRSCIVKRKERVIQSHHEPFLVDIDFLCLRLA
jgi:hypothetical protein